MKHRLIELENPPRKAEFVAVWKSSNGFIYCGLFVRRGSELWRFDSDFSGWTLTDPDILKNRPIVLFK